MSNMSNMSNFAQMLANQAMQRKTFTDNGAVAYESSGKKLLDFNFAVTALRGADEKKILDMYSESFFEDPLVAVKFLFWLRDCRGGNGERRIFRVCLKWLTTLRPEVVKALIPLVPEYGRFDDLWGLLETSLKSDVVDYVDKKLIEDHENMTNGKPISLLAKWMPSENTSSLETRRFGAKLRAGLGLKEAVYRKTLSKFRSYLRIVEKSMCRKEWGEIDYSAVPSKANLKYNRAFLRNDEERRRAFLESLKRGETKINSSTNQPHEIVAKYWRISGWGNSLKNYDETLEQLWKALPDVTIGDTLVVRDGSSSMTNDCGTKVKPMNVATALAVYMSEHNQGIWKDVFLTFSNNPKFVSLEKCKNLREKLEVAYRENECRNTDIAATMMLVLNTATKNHCTQDEMPKNILILSDMQFDSMVDFGSYYIGGYSCSITDNRATLFEELATRFEAVGYKMPRIIFWNLSGRVNGTVPMQQNELGVVLCSGFSVQLMKMVMSGKTDPYEVLLDTLNDERYQPVEDLVKDLI